MLDGSTGIPSFRLEKIAADTGPGQGRKGGFTDKFKCAFCHHYTYFSAFLNEEP